VFCEGHLLLFLVDFSESLKGMIIKLWLESFRGEVFATVWRNTPPIFLHEGRLVG
jgi:hypothetical protein